MASSLGLALYLIAAGRTAEGADRPLPAPPAGAGPVWLHAPEGGTPLAGLCALARRLEAARRGLGLILTHPAEAPPPPEALPPGTLALPALSEHPALLHRAMALWQPAVLVLGNGPLPPALIHAAEEADRHAFLVDATVPRIDPLGAALPGLQRTLLRRLRRILVRDAAAGRAFRRAGARPWRIEEAGPLALSSGPLPHNAAEREALARRITARPVWLAVAVPEAEEAVVLAAHRAALRLAHRLLLILVPADPGRGPELARRAEAMGLRTARRGAEAEPDDDHQLYIADTEGELGLWYRLAPVTFMGGTLTAGSGRDPFEAAALGSVLVHGPVTGPVTGAAMAPTLRRSAAVGAGGGPIRPTDPLLAAEDGGGTSGDARAAPRVGGPPGAPPGGSDGMAERYSRLMRSRASWRIPGLQTAPAVPAARRGLWRRGAPDDTPAAPADPAAAALTEALVALLAPDRVATMAQAGWTVATEGAEVTDRAVALILAALDEVAT